MDNMIRRTLPKTFNLINEWLKSFYCIYLRVTFRTSISWISSSSSFSPCRRISRFYQLLFCGAMIAMCWSLIDDEQSDDLGPYMTFQEDVKVPRVMQRIYQKFRTSNMKQAKAVKSIAVEVTQIDDGTFLMSFPIPESENSTLRKAQLWIEMPEGDKKAHQTQLSIEIRSASEDPDCRRKVSKKLRIRDSYLELMVNITSFYVNCRDLNMKYFRFKIRLNVQSTGVQYMGLRAEFMDAFIILKEISNFSHEVFKMFAVLERTNSIKENYKVRRKRRAENRRNLRTRQNKRTCGLQSWYVTFENLGWDWVVAPPDGFNLNICKGICRFPLSSKMNTTNHAIVQTLMHTLHGKPRPACCVPKNTTSQTVYYLDDRGDINFKTFPDMGVESCACL